MKEKEPKMTTYPNATRTKWHNKSVMVFERDGKFWIEFRYADEKADEPACRHRCLRGKVRQTTIHLSQDAIEYLMMTYIEHKKARL